MRAEHRVEASRREERPKPRPYTHESRLLFEAGQHHADDEREHPDEREVDERRRGEEARFDIDCGHDSRDEESPRNEVTEDVDQVQIDSGVPFAMICSYN